jgi:hydroxymethylpyrimidine/phosphomethylpyrimidine kinase
VTRSRSHAAVPIALTIAGSDSGGGAGIQADLKAFQRFHVFGTSVLTAITAQNTQGVSAWEAVSVPLVRAQLEAVATDLRPAAVKSGMLATADVVREVAEGIRTHALAPYVLDPVMVATSGDLLVNDGTVAAIRTQLVPLAALVTPNLDEAQVLLGVQVHDVPSMEQAARSLVHEHGAGAALVKGGHLPGLEMVDVLYLDGEISHFRHPRVDTTSLHGTGCTLSAAIAAHLARGNSMRESVRSSLDYVHRAILTAPALGSGHGPLNHWI